MTRFLVDENTPRSLAGAIRSAGHEATDVRDVGLRGKSDAEVLTYATKNGLVLMSRDADFGNVRRFPLGTHRGIIVALLHAGVLVGTACDDQHSVAGDSSDGLHDRRGLLSMAAVEVEMQTERTPPPPSRSRAARRKRAKSSPGRGTPARRGPGSSRALGWSGAGMATFP